MPYFSLLLVGGVSLFHAAVFAAQVKSIDFIDSDRSSLITLTSDGPLSFEQREDPTARQLILTLQGAELGPSASRALDTSSFQSPVVLVTPFPADSGAAPQVVVQFKEGAFTNANIEQVGNEIRIQVPKSGNTEYSLDAEIDALDGGGSSRNSASAENASSMDDGLDEAIVSSTKAESTPKDDLDQFFENQKTKNFTGTPITLNVRNADVRDVLRLIGESSGFNMIIGAGVAGQLSLSLTEVPWDHVLDVVLQTLNLGAERNENVLRILTLQNLTQEKEQQQRASQAIRQSAPKVTRVFPISYSELGPLVTLLQQFGSQQGSQTGSQPMIAPDERTNSIIVQDTLESIDRMQKLIEILDTETPQVLIEGKVVEATEGFSRSLGGFLGSGGTKTVKGIGGGGFASMNAANPTEALLGSVFSDGSQIAGLTSGGGGFGLGFVANGLALNAFLNVKENESRIKVIASPRTVVLNGRQTSITFGQPTFVTAPGNGLAAGQIITNSADLSLQARPTVTNDDRVQLNLTLQRNQPVVISSESGQSLVAQRTMTTDVLVPSGQTLVIGGIYTMQQTESSQGFPFLRKIPVLGWLFGSDVDETSRSELFFFVTPTILNRNKSVTADSGMQASG